MLKKYKSLAITVKNEVPTTQCWYTVTYMYIKLLIFWYMHAQVKQIKKKIGSFFCVERKLNGN